MRQKDLEDFLSNKLAPMVATIPSDGTGITASALARKIGANPHTVARWLQIAHFIQEHVPKFRVKPSGSFMIYYRERREPKVEIRE